MSPPLKVAYLVMKYPTLSQTFIEREMLGLVGQGLQVEVHPCFDFRRPRALGGWQPPAGLEVVRADSRRKLLGAALRETWRVLRLRPKLAWQGLRTLLANLPRHGEGWFMTLWGTFFALAQAEEFRTRHADAAIVHGAWATAPATAAAVLGALCDRPFSFGAHAYDLHRHGGDPLLKPKLAAARFVHTTTQASADHLAAKFPRRRAEIVLARRGLAKLPPLPDLPAGAAQAVAVAAARSREDTGVRILSVGRLVEKKGHAHQIEACWELNRRGRTPFRLRIVGDGPLRSALATQIAGSGLADRIELLGEQTPAQTEAAYEWADIFWHTGIVDSQGDRDGLPNVIPEAFAHGLAVISSAAGGAAEAVHDGETGLLANPEDAPALADAVERLAADLPLRAQLGAAGRAWTEENFLIEKNARRLAEAFRKATGGS